MSLIFVKNVFVVCLFLLIAGEIRHLNGAEIESSELELDSGIIILKNKHKSWNMDNSPGTFFSLISKI